MEENSKTLEKEKELLMSYYSEDDISFFESLLNEVSALTSENMMFFSYYKKEDGSNG